MTKNRLLLASFIGTAFFSLIVSSMTTASATLHSNNDTTFQKLQIDGRERSGITASVNHFKFSAENICNENLPKHGRCLDISGGGSTSADTIAANGNYVTYLQKPIDLSNIQILSRGLWFSTGLQGASSTEMSFSAHASAGNVFIQLVEGDSENSGKVCVYGPLIAIADAEDAVCVDDAFVVIGSMDAQERIDTSIASLEFSASHLCNAVVSSNGLCLDIWGKGGTNENTFAASGNFETHPLESGKVNIRGTWEATELYAAAEDNVSLKLASSAGNLYLKLVEGSSENSGLACAYGPLIGISNAEDAACVDDAFVVIVAIEE